MLLRRQNTSFNVTSFTLVWIKINAKALALYSTYVTSFTLVWIKMLASDSLSEGLYVTSFTLVWIKILWPGLVFMFIKSRASRSCGLKWNSQMCSCCTDKSRASRSCGLKYFLFSATRAALTASRASRSCGLKCTILLRLVCFPCVTSFTLVWIKIIFCPVEVPNWRVTSFTLVWIKMPSDYPDQRRASRHELHARVD